MWFAVPNTNVVKPTKYPRIVLMGMLLLLTLSKAYGYPQQWTNPMPTSGMKEGFTIAIEEQRNTIVGPVPVCEGSTFCEDVPNYPLDVVMKAVAKDFNLIRYAHVEMVDRNLNQIDLPDEEPLCVSIERTVYPRSGENMNKQWRFIVNYSEFLQSTRVETCVEEGTSCRMIEGFAEGYITSCKQKYIYRQLVAIDENGNPYLDYFRFPASCCCHVQFTGEY